jgi:regulator of sirC expression with transglutaminase-like and TPR domain
MSPDDQVREFVAAAESDAADSMVRAAILLGALERPSVDPGPALATLAEMGETASLRLQRAPTGAAARVSALNAYLFGELGFRGNDRHYDDPRNSFLDEVLARRTGIPISLSVVYIDVARRAGLALEGVNFPGHFLVREAGENAAAGDHPLIIDPFNRGVRLSEPDCQHLLERHVGPDAIFSRDLLAPADKRQILIRMLTNLKRIYVRCRSYPQARTVTEMLIAVDPSSSTELRDRGLLDFQLKRFPEAVAALESYLRGLGNAPQQADEETRKEYEQIWEHIKALKRRMASFN